MPHAFLSYILSFRTPCQLQPYTVHISAETICPILPLATIIVVRSGRLFCPFIKCIYIFPSVYSRVILPGAYYQPVQVPGKFIFTPGILFYKNIIKVFDRQSSLNYCVAGHSITLSVVFILTESYRPIISL